MSLNQWAKEIRRNQLKKEKDKPKDKPVYVNKSKIREKNELINCLTVILRTKGCSWARESGCTMCGYIYDSAKEVEDRDIFNQFKESIKKYGTKKPFVLKIFTSGSFLDKKEISKNLRDKIIDYIKREPKIRKLIIESRPEFITQNNLMDLLSEINKLEIAIGLETTNDEIRKDCINKNFTYNDFLKAAELIKDHNINLKTYLLLKPPFLTEKTAIEDIKSSIDDLRKLNVDKISINPCNIQKGTIVEYLFERDEYNPPWIWSLTDILKEYASYDFTLVSEPVAGGKKRGIHNCGKCDNEVLERVKDFSLHQDQTVFNETECECKLTWKNYVEIERKLHNTPKDFRRSTPKNK
ncbi:MAG: MiaB family Radical SAM enzyme [Candidatus Methanohalarchaeum thermophilum]|uniref:MiaB family Radical SAM enzyme n=1 Tax=Methanohalarchaeum thermophilum TaxID=1903181 RepID=A0A1Q6DUW6_METT1|nr:MAG: MiaB family Radical SAM enzyme [Candidatus Methanohalarchaeum thermophilum]